MKLDQFTQFRFSSLTEEGWNRIEEYIQYQDDLWDEPSHSMNISSILEAMQPTLRGRLKRACKQIAFLETPTREVGLKNPYLICDYCRGSDEADECEQNNPSEQEKGEMPGWIVINLSLKTRSPTSMLEKEITRKRIGTSCPTPEGIALKKQKKDDEDERLLLIFKQIHINLSFLEAMIHMLKGAKVLKDILSHKEKLETTAFSVRLDEECSAIIQRSLPQKEGDPSSFTLPCLIGPLAVKNALADLGASINLMPHSLATLRISIPKPNKMSISLDELI
ncbi:hypothetical protein Tco_0992649 [Tanacetum coccineum]|uniref:Uncharacterized protein n=1 Tax=Tanacetum coccineum TaxID=301880 RepID=A0ABQ5F2V5_9ASTR